MKKMDKTNSFYIQEISAMHFPNYEKYNSQGNY